MRTANAVITAAETITLNAAIGRFEQHRDVRAGYIADVDGGITAVLCTAPTAVTCEAVTTCGAVPEFPVEARLIESRNASVGELISLRRTAIAV
ncbi:hypothetical protein CFN78_14860 [Amycolatopsis antarctica]|uniref:Uncharacterized protein n=1 Tax=Amycolatopsis antarctica TaxID=1854586 RepID=A0A263D1G3_9PSEU|nr:hypothetical protein [Amycolatopsis antarctica]OZM72293.1 hypothetical protein CFN78_14860 [Amycolatopsis antarctica]